MIVTLLVISYFILFCLWRLQCMSSFWHVYSQLCPNRSIGSEEICLRENKSYVGSKTLRNEGKLTCIGLRRRQVLVRVNCPAVIQRNTVLKVSQWLCYTKNMPVYTTASPKSVTDPIWYRLDLDQFTQSCG